MGFFNNLFSKKKNISSGRSKSNSKKKKSVKKINQKIGKKVTKKKSNKLSKKQSKRVNQIKNKKISNKKQKKVHPRIKQSLEKTKKYHPRIVRELKKERKSKEKKFKILERKIKKEGAFNSGLLNSKKSEITKDIKAEPFKKNEMKVLKDKNNKEINKPLKSKSNKETKFIGLKKDTKKILKNRKIQVVYRGNGDGEGFLKTCVPGFDELVYPGLPAGAAILVEGGPGSGKTLWCLTFLKEMVKRGKKVLFMSFEEPEERLRQHIASFGIDPLVYERKGLLYLKRFNALDIARSVEALLSEAKKELLIDVQPVLIPKDFEPDIVIIDSLSSISSAFSGESSRFRIYMEQLFRYLESHNITSFLIREVSSPTHIGGTIPTHEEAVSFLSDGIIAIYNVIYNDGHRKRAIEILKMRGVQIERKICDYEITPQGVVINPNKILSGENYKLT